MQAARQKDKQSDSVALARASGRGCRSARGWLLACCCLRRLAPHRCPGHGRASPGPGMRSLRGLLPGASGGPVPSGWCIPTPSPAVSPPLSMEPGYWCRERETVSLGHRSARAEGSKGPFFFFFFFLSSLRDRPTGNTLTEMLPKPVEWLSLVSLR